MYVGAYEADDTYNEVKVTFADHSMPVFLFVSSYHAVNWIIDNPMNIEIQGIAYSSLSPRSSLMADESVPVFEIAGFGYGYDNFSVPIADINRIIGRGPNQTIGDYDLEDITITHTGSFCTPDADYGTVSCVDEITHSAEALKSKTCNSDGSDFVYGSCTLSSCEDGFHISDNSCEADLPQQDPCGNSSWQDISTSFERNNGPLYDIAVDSQCNMILVGTSETNAFGTPINATNWDGFVAKFTPEGELLWVRTFGVSSSGQGRAVDLDEQDNIYVIGETWASVDSQPYAGYSDIVMISFGPSGNRRWTYQFGYNKYDMAHDIAVTADGNVYGFGYTQTGAYGGDDALLIKVSTQGIHQWNNRYGSPGDEYGYSMAVDSSSNVYITGPTYDQSFIQAGNGQSDAYLLKIAPSGSVLARARFGVADYDYGREITVDKATGNVYLVRDTFSNSDIYVTALTSNLNMRWEQKISGSSSREHAGDVKIDSDGNVYVLGSTLGNVGGVNAGSFDMILAKYNASGDLLWIKQYGSSKKEFTRGMSFDLEGNIIVVSMYDNYGIVMKFNPDGVRQ